MFSSRAAFEAAYPSYGDYGAPTVDGYGYSGSTWMYDTGQSSPAGPQPKSLEDQIGAGFDKAAGIVTGASRGAGDLLTQGYRDLLRTRISGVAGALGTQEQTIGSQVASRGLSSDVGSRMVYQPRAAAQQAIGGAIGDTGSGLAFDQAQLLKGTGGELAGLTTEQLSDLINLRIGKDAAKATKSAGIAGGLGSIAGGLLGGLLKL